MARPRSIPQLTRHLSGRAVVRSDGRDHYCGWYGTPEAESEYNQIVSRWLANDRRLEAVGSPERTVNEVVLAFLQWAKGHYKTNDHGISTEYEACRLALRILREKFGRSPAATFGPKMLKQVRAVMLAKDWSRRHVNHQTNRIKRCFKWATEGELVPPAVYQGLRAVAAVRPGAPGTRDIKPVATLARLQLLTGARPGELVVLRTRDVDTSGRVWIYRVESPKTSHLGHERQIYFGPQAQAVLRPWLKTDLTAFVFSPAEAEQVRIIERRVARTTPLFPSHIRHMAKKRKKKRARPPHDRYTTASYHRAILRACDKALPPPAHLAPQDGETRMVWLARLTTLPVLTSSTVTTSVPPIRRLSIAKSRDSRPD